MTRTFLRYFSIYGLLFSCHVIVDNVVCSSPVDLVPNVALEDVLGWFALWVISWAGRNRISATAVGQLLAMVIKLVAYLVYTSDQVTDINATISSQWQCR